MVKRLFLDRVGNYRRYRTVNKRHQLVSSILPGLAPAFTAREDQAAPFTDVAADLITYSFLQERFADEILIHSQ